MFRLVRNTSSIFIFLAFSLASCTRHQVDTTPPAPVAAPPPAPVAKANPAPPPPPPPATKEETKVILSGMCFDPNNYYCQNNVPVQTLPDKLSRTDKRCLKAQKEFCIDVVTNYVKPDPEDPPSSGDYFRCSFKGPLPTVPAAENKELDKAVVATVKECKRITEKLKY